MTTTPTKIIERIRALLALASNNPSEAEAASAAERAAKLMAEHHLAQAEIEAAGGEVEEDSIGSELIDDGKGYNETWKRVLLFAIRRLFGVELISMSGKVTAFGRLSDVQTVKYTYAYLTNEIENQAQAYWISIGPVERLASAGKRSACNDFRRGAAGRLQARMLEMRREQDARDRAARAAASPGALLVIQRGALEVQDAYRAFLRSQNLRAAKPSSTRGRDSDAAKAGRAAGDSMRISGGAGALGAEARRLGAVR